MRRPTFIRLSGHLLAALVTGASVLGCLALLRNHLEQTARQSVDDFAKQNLEAIVTGDTFQLATRLNAMASSAHWVCVSAEHSGQAFFSRQTGRGCGSGLFRTTLALVRPENDRLAIRFTVALAEPLRWAGILFGGMQLTLLWALFWGGRIAARREERLHVKSELELAELAAQVAHDIRSPLAALDGFVSRAAPSLPEDERTLVRSVSARIGGIAEALLARYRAGLERQSAPRAKEPEQPAPMSIAPIVQEIVAEKLTLSSGSTPRISTRVAPGDYTAAVEPVELGRVLSNLLNNAIEAQADKPGGIEVSVQGSAAELRISVRDQGPGIPEKVLRALGKKGATFGKREGSGLGLYHARKTCEAWGGSLEITSRPGEGTTASIVLPRAPAVSTERTEALGLAAPDAVLIDDDALVRLSWKQAAQAARKRVLTFATPEAFLRDAVSFERATPIYADQELGGGRLGLDLLRALRDQGFSALHLATGHSPDRIGAPEWVAGVVGKAPPWSPART